MLIIYDSLVKFTHRFGNSKEPRWELGSRDDNNSTDKKYDWNKWRVAPERSSLPLQKIHG